MRDRTASLARKLRRFLADGEQVLAAVAVAPKGTFAASLSAAGRWSDGVGSSPDDERLGSARDELHAVGIVPAGRYWLSVTDRRVLLVTRTLLNRPGVTALDVPVADVAGIAVSTQGQHVALHLPGGVAKLETPKALKFLPDVYARLPTILDEAKAGR